MSSILPAPLSGSLDIHTYRRLYDRVHRAMAHFLGRPFNFSEDLVEDGTQRVLEVLVRRLNEGATFPTLNHLQKFLREAVMHIARSLRIERGKARKRFAALDESVAQVAADVTPSETQTLLRHVLRRLANEHGMLSPTQQRLLDGLAREESYDEIAGALGWTALYARVSAHRLRKALRARVPEVNEVFPGELHAPELDKRVPM